MKYNILDDIRENHLELITHRQLYSKHFAESSASTFS